MQRHRVIAAGLGLVIGIGSAGPIGGPAWAEERAAAKRSSTDKGRTEDGLGLTDEQRHQMQQIRQEYKTRREALRTQLEALREEEQGQVRALLTPEQQARWDEKRARRKHGAGERRADGPRRPKPAEAPAETATPKKSGWGFWGPKSGEEHAR